MEMAQLKMKFHKCMEACPPDLDAADQILAQGLDINERGSSEGESLLSDIMFCYPLNTAIEICGNCAGYACDNCAYNRDRYDGRYLPAVVRFFLEKGYDVHRAGGKYGAYALKNLCCASADPYILDAAKLLLDAGADPRCVIDAQNQENVLDIVDSVTWTGEGLERECLLFVLHEIMEAKAMGLPYAGYAWADAVIGKRIDRVFSCASTRERAVFDFETGGKRYRNCFREDMILVCEGAVLAVNRYCHAYVRSCGIPAESVDLSDVLGGLIGKRIAQIQFLQEADCTLVILLDDGSRFLVMDNAGQASEEYCARILIP